jgi:GNAT superfamily N-acetyltransferase
MKSESPAPTFCGYYPGLIGEVTALHAAYYAERHGFTRAFECQVARDLAEFAARAQGSRDLLLAVRRDGRLVGFLAVDGSLSDGLGARLRWFIVDPDEQGRGLGGLLLERAVAFLREAGFARAFLWTFRGLDAARRLYERHGFLLVEEREASPWGPPIVEQRFALELAAG